jgi:hypothetical protein
VGQTSNPVCASTSSLLLRERESGLGCIYGTEAHISPHPHQVCPCRPLLFLLCVRAHVNFPLISFWGSGCGVMVTATQLATVVVTLDASWDLPMDCLSCGRGCAGGWGLGARVVCEACIGHHPCRGGWGWLCAVHLPWLVPNSRLRPGVGQGT